VSRWSNGIVGFGILREGSCTVDPPLGLFVEPEEMGMEAPDLGLP